MFPEPVDNIDDANVLAQPFDPRLQAAEPADDQTDLTPFLRGGVQSVDDCLVSQRIEFGGDHACLALLLPLAFHLDQLDQFVAQPGRSGVDAAELLRIGMAGYRIEEFGRIRSQFFVAGQQADITEEPSRRFAIVTRPEVDVSLDPGRFATHDDAELGMGPQALDPVNDLHCRLFQRLGPLQLVRVPEPRFEFNDRRHIFVVLGGSYQRVHDRAVAVGAVERLFDGHDIRIFCRLFDQPHDGQETVIGVVQQDILGGERVEHAAGQVDIGRGLRWPGIIFEFLEAEQVVQLAEGGQVERSRDAKDTLVRYM